MKVCFQPTLMLSLLLMLSTSLAIADPCIETFKGDLSGDDAVGLADAVIGLKICSGSESHAPPSGSDVDGNETIGLEDVAYILQVAAGFRPDIPSIQGRLEPELQKTGAGLEMYPTTGEHDLSPFIFRNNLGPNGSDEITIRFVAEDSDPCGENPDPASGVASRCDLLPSLTVQDQVPINSSEFSVIENLATTPYSAWDNGCYCQGTIYEPPRWGMPVLIKTPADYEPAAANVVYITSVQPNWSKLQIRPFPGETNRLQDSFPPDSSVSFFLDRPIKSVRFFVSNANVLMREDGDGTESTPLFENVRNIQFAFGIDEDQDGLVENWIEDDPADALDVESICLILIE